MVRKKKKPVKLGQCTKIQMIEHPDSFNEDEKFQLKARWDDGQEVRYISGWGSTENEARKDYGKNLQRITQGIE